MICITLRTTGLRKATVGKLRMFLKFLGISRQELSPVHRLQMGAFKTIQIADILHISFHYKNFSKFPIGAAALLSKRKKGRSQTGKL